MDIGKRYWHVIIIGGITGITLLVAIVAGSDAAVVVFIVMLLIFFATLMSLIPDEEGHAKKVGKLEKVGPGEMKVNLAWIQAQYDQGYKDGNENKAAYCQAASAPHMHAYFHGWWAGNADRTQKEKEQEQFIQTIVDRVRRELPPPPPPQIYQV